MAQWNKTPAWTEPENIITKQATRKTGLTAEQFNAIVENIQYLKNSTVEVKQESGQSTTAVMSQKAVTDAINNAITTTLNTAV